MSLRKNHGLRCVSKRWLGVQTANFFSSRRLRIESLENRRMLAVFMVSNTDDSGPGSLREAIVQANAVEGLDTIEFDDSVFTGGENSVIRLTSGQLRIADSLIVDGSTGTDIVITADAVGNDQLVPGTFITDVDASLANDPQSLDDNSRVIQFEGSLGTFAISDLTITGGRSMGGGAGVFFDGTSLTITGSKINGNSSNAWGGGVLAYPLSSGGNEVDISVMDSEVSGNRARGGGGGIFAGASVHSSKEPTIVVHGSKIEGNQSVKYGGGIAAVDGTFTLSESVVSENITEGSFSQDNFSQGGGIYVFSSDARIRQSTISGNVSRGATAFGGGIHMQLANLVIENSTISENLAGGGRIVFGGGISGNYASILVAKTTISNNRATAINPFAGVPGSYGGGIGLRSGELVTVTDSTITGNEASIGGGISVLSSGTGLTVENSIVADNYGTVAAHDIRPSDGSLTMNHSLIGVADSITQEILGNEGNLTGTAENPLDPLLGPLTHNGGPTETHALLPGSPALNAGDPNVPFLPTEFDQRGAGYSRVAFDRIDIGSYEAQVTPSSDFDRDGDVDGTDFLAWQLGFGTEYATRSLGNSDDDTDVDASDLAAWSVGYGLPEHLAVGTQASRDDERLIDAVLGVLGSENGAKELALPDERQSPETPIGRVLVRPTAGRSAYRDIEPRKSAPKVREDINWLSDDLLEQVFG